MSSSATSRLSTRKDGKYIHRGKLAQYASRRLHEIQAVSSASRTDDEHLILYLMEMVGDLGKQIDRIADRHREPMSGGDFFMTEYERLLIIHEGVMDALRANGYQGDELAANVSRWLARC